MGPQEVYAKLVETEAAGLFPGYDGEYCLYRAPNGHKCAVGCFLTDEEAAKAHKGQSVGGIFQCQEDVRNRLTAGGIRVDPWMSLQGAHDGLAATWDGQAFLKKARAILGIPEPEASPA